MPQMIDVQQKKVQIKQRKKWKYSMSHTERIESLYLYLRFHLLILILNELKMSITFNLENENVLHTVTNFWFASIYTPRTCLPNIL